jgi:uncharacterized coiled-coil protein SlyX
MGTLMMLAAGGDGAGLPDPTGYAAIGWLLVSAAALITGVNQFREFFAGMKDKPSGAEAVEKAEKMFVAKGTCDVLHAEQDRRIEELAATLTQNQKDSVEQRRKIYEKLESLKDQLPLMEGRINSAQGTAIGKVHDRVNALQQGINDILLELSRKKNVTGH